ncbi:hypothetical protein FPV67DRAFT_401982 [Lyophyllum atratum]|nr:hypothetical protein FPV67DRAFT_401982 [Lyophyllum atratum]
MPTPYRFWDHYQPRGIPIPRRRPGEPRNVNTPFVSTVRPPLYPATPLSPAFVHPVQFVQQTPWTQPQSMPAFFACTPIWPSTPAVPLAMPQTTPWTQPPYIPPLPPRPPVWPTTPVVPLAMPQTTPWTQPQCIPVLPACMPCTPVWPAAPVVPLAIPCANAWQFRFPENLEPGTFPAVPFGTPVPIRIHPVLVYNPVNPAIAALEWDISHRAEQARKLTGRQVLVTPDLSGPATVPVTSQIWIYSDHALLASWMESWGPIIIERADISARDVLDAIFEYMRKPLTNEDVLRVRMGGGMTNLERSARLRIRDGHELRAVARRNGYMRVDVLGGHRKFLGLRAEVYPDRTWKVFMGLRPGPVAY